MKKIMMVAVCALCANVFAEAQRIGDTTTTWELIGDVLTIGGTGDMPDWGCGETSNRPWDYGTNIVKSVIVVEGVTRIGVNAFVHFHSLTNITMTTSVTNVGEQAFGVCGSLRSVTIPSGVASIEANAFYGSLWLSVMMESETPPELGWNAFGNVSFCTISIYLPARCKEAYVKGIGWSDYESNISEAYFVTIAPTEHGTVTVDKKKLIMQEKM